MSLLNWSHVELLMNYSHAYNLEACSLREPVVGACPILGNPTYRASLDLALKCTVIFHAQILFQLPIATIIFDSIFQLQINSELVDALFKALHIILATQLWEARPLASNVHNGAFCAMTLGFPNLCLKLLSHEIKFIAQESWLQKKHILPKLSSKTKSF